METVRNHVQHRSLALRGFMVPVDYEEVCRDDDRWRVTVVPHLDLESLQANPKVKRAVVQEFLDRALPPDVTRSLRIYLECLCRIHETIRTICKDDYERAILILMQARIEAMAKSLGKSQDGTIAVAALARDARGQPQRVLYLNDIVIEQISQLRARNRSFEDLAKRYVASSRGTT